jgi:hypothetical protein
MIALYISHLLIIPHQFILMGAQGAERLTSYIQLSGLYENWAKLFSFPPLRRWQQKTILEDVLPISSMGFQSTKMIRI